MYHYALTLSLTIIQHSVAKEYQAAPLNLTTHKPTQLPYTYIHVYVFKVNLEDIFTIFLLYFHILNIYLLKKSHDCNNFSIRTHQYFFRPLIRTVIHYVYVLEAISFLLTYRTKLMQILTEIKRQLTLN